MNPRAPVLTRNPDLRMSAREVLLDLMNYLVKPTGGAMWTGTAVSAAAALGIEEKTVRQALARLASDDVVTVTRHGRFARWSLRDQSTQTELAYGNRSTGVWDGMWVLVASTLPETERRLRADLRDRLTRSGFMSPQPGLWIAADAASEVAATLAIAELGLAGRSLCWVGRLSEITDERSLVHRLWDLDTHRRRIEDVIRNIEAIEPSGHLGHVVGYLCAIRHYAELLANDPGLPSALLPQDWPDSSAEDHFRRRQRELRSPALKEWRNLDRRCSPAAAD